MFAICEIGDEFIGDELVFHTVANHHTLSGIDVIQLLTSPFILTSTSQTSQLNVYKLLARSHTTRSGRTRNQHAMQCFVGAPVGVSGFRGARVSSVCVARKARFAAAKNARVAAPIRMGLVPFVPNWLLLGGWIFGSYRFFKGFKSTDYRPGYRIPLALLWPIFMLVNANFRANFMRAYRNPSDY